jgi:hypothetical protein
MPAPVNSGLTITIGRPREGNVEDEVCETVGGKFGDARVDIWGSINAGEPRSAISGEAETPA